MQNHYVSRYYFGFTVEDLLGVENIIMTEKYLRHFMMSSL